MINTVLQFVFTIHPWVFPVLLLHLPQTAKPVVHIKFIISVYKNKYLINQDIL